MPDPNPPTLVDRWLVSLKNNPVIAAVVIVASAVSGVAALPSAMDKIMAMVYPPMAAPLPVITRQVDGVHPAPAYKPPAVQSAFPATSSSGLQPLALEPCLPVVTMLRKIHGADPLTALSDPASLSDGLVQASADGNLACAQLLLGAGASPNGGAGLAAGTEDQTPLVAAIQAGNVKIVQALLDAGANPNLRALKGNAPSWSAGLPPIVAAARSGDIMRELLKRKADVNAAGPDGITALHQVAASGDFASVKELVELGADTNARWLDQTPLAVAKAHKHLEIIRYLTGK